MQSTDPKSTLEAATAKNNLPADAQADLAEEKTTKPKQPNALDRYAVPQSTLEDATKIKTTCILHRVARRKDATFFFGPPGAAKTLLAVGLLIKSSELGQIDPESVYYINADDNQQGLSTKNKIFSEYGIKMLAPMHQGFNERQLPRLLYELIDSGHAADMIILLDTGKKFYDPMSKESCRSFMTSVRHFVGAGGSVIILAHTNKWTRSDGSLIPGGTSDVLDDCDAAYTLRTISGSADSEEKQCLSSASRIGAGHPVRFVTRIGPRVLIKMSSPLFVRWIRPSTADLTREIDRTKNGELTSSKVLSGIKQTPRWSSEMRLPRSQKSASSRHSKRSNATPVPTQRGITGGLRWGGMELTNTSCWMRVPPTIRGSTDEPQTFL